MKNLIFFILTLLFIVSCKNGNSSKEPVDQAGTSTDSVINQKTYAEISIRKGGSWENQKYLGGKFENVTEIELPESHTDHSGFIRYEGPGWENKNVAYRLYLDWRNAIDIFGKKVDTLVLPFVGQDGFDSYHKEASWGQDILKAGKSMGIGGFGRLMNDSVAHFHNVKKTIAKVKNEADKSSVIIQYSNWDTGDKIIDLSAKLSIYPQNVYTKVVLNTSEKINGLTTGIVRNESIPLMHNDTLNNDWAYIATYGSQTLVNETDKLGMAIIYKKSQLEKVVTGEHDHLVVFKPTTGNITYYFLGAWEQQKNGIVTEEEFNKYLVKTLENLESENIENN